MEVSGEQYEAMLGLVGQLLSSGSLPQPDQCAAAGVDYDAVTSLYNQVSVRHLKREAKRGIDGVLLSSFASGATGALVDELAEKYKVGGYKLARTYLEFRFGKGAVTLAQFLETPCMVQDASLRGALLKNMAKDPFCAHPLEQLKECVGKEYEEYLIARLQEKNLCFETEAELRSRGKPKTPDILFLIPMATYNCSDPSNGLVVVNWIDSKAMFADEETLAEHFEQLRGYTNRYGRGLVIYWHGYLENITSSDLFASFDDMVVITSTFPETWFYPGGQSGVIEG